MPAAQHDSRFPAALAQLQERGFAVNESGPEYLASEVRCLELSQIGTQREPSEATSHNLQAKDYLGNLPQPLELPGASLQ